MLLTFKNLSRILRLESASQPQNLRAEPQKLERVTPRSSQWWVVQRLPNLPHRLFTWNLYFWFWSHFYFLSEFCFQNNAKRLIPRPSRARDLVTMAEVGSTRYTSLERVATGVGSVSRGARAKPNSLGTSLRLSVPEGAHSVTFCPKLLLTNRKCQEITVTIYATTNTVFTTIQCWRQRY